MQSYQFKQCILNKHETYDTSILCIYELCKAKTRIACIKCVQEFHSDHASQCLLMEDLIAEKLEQIPQATQELRQKIDSLVKLTEDNGEADAKQIDKQFEDLHTQVVKSVEIQRLDLRSKYKQKQELFGDLIKDLINEFQELFQIAPIQQAFQNFCQEKITLQQLNRQIKEFTENQDRNQKRSNLLTLYKNCLEKLPNIDKQEVTYLKQKLQEELGKIPSLVRIPGNWYFLVPQIYQYNTNLKAKEGALQIEFNNQDSQQYVYGSHPMKYPVYYSWSYIIDEAQGMSYNTVYIGIVQDAFKEDMNQMFSIGKCVYLDIINNSITQYLQIKAGKKTISQVIKDNAAKKQPTTIQFYFDTKKKHLVIQDSEELSKYEYSKSIIKKATSNLQNQYNAKQHLDFFKETNIFRPFIMNYNGIFKVTLQ